MLLRTDGFQTAGFNNHPKSLTSFLVIFPQNNQPLKKAFLFFVFILTYSLSAFSQDSCSLRISLLTCAPGAELYSTFGHTAIRVQDPQNGLDDVYNYGTFEFDEDFYAKFVRGKLLYALAVQSFDEFIYQYQMESRSVISQELSLTCPQKEELLVALHTNALPQNRSYRYDFLFDNCTTRARDMVDSGAGATVALGNILQPEPYTFRNHIDVYLNRAKQDWSKLGIDLLLGSKMDRAATNREAMFLPDNLMLAFDKSTADGKPLVAAKQTILDLPSLASESLLITPIIAFSILLVLMAALTFIKSSWARQAVAVLDFVLFFSLGCVGLLLLFMWFGTDHALCANNYNLLWALPTNLLTAFVVHKQLRWVKVYFTIVFWITVLLLVTWKFLPQQMNSGFLPLVFAIALRSRVLSKSTKNAGKAS